MNCQETIDKIHRYCDGDVSPQEHAKISLHLDKCSVCRCMYQLTTIENDVLGEKDDIPDLSPAFASMVMNTLQLQNITNKKTSTRFNRKLWFSGLTAVAAAIALFLYLPHFISVDSQFLDISPQQEQVPQSIASTQYDLYNADDQVKLPDSPKSDSSDQVNVPDSAKSDSQDTDLKIAAESTDKSAPPIDNINTQPMLLAGTGSSASTNINSAPTVTRSALTDRIDSGNFIVNDSLRPTNIPDRLRFVQVSNNENQTIFDYTSLDGKEYLQLTLISTTQTSTEIISGNNQMSQASSTLSKNMQIADKNVTVILTGNLPWEEMTKLIETLEFQNTTAN